MTATGRPLVMVVDDSLPMRLLAKKTLSAAGMDIEEAENGLQGYKKAQQLTHEGRHISLILLDLNMPQLNGIGCLQKIRETPETKDIPVIMVTSQNDRTSIMACAKFGLQGYIVKPYTTERLLSESRKIIFKEMESGEHKADTAAASLSHIDEATKANLLDRLEEALRNAVECEDCNLEAAENCPVGKMMHEVLAALKTE